MSEPTDQLRCASTSGDRRCVQEPQHDGWHCDDAAQWADGPAAVTDPRQTIRAALDADDQRARAASRDALGDQIYDALMADGFDERDAGRAMSVALAALSPQQPSEQSRPCPDTNCPWHGKRIEHIAAHDPETVLRRNTGVRAVVEMHAPVAVYAAMDLSNGIDNAKILDYLNSPQPVDHYACSTCDTTSAVAEVWPCPTIRALANAYAPGWDTPEPTLTADREVDELEDAAAAHREEAP